MLSTGVASGSLQEVARRIAEGRRLALAVSEALREEGLRDETWRVLLALSTSEGLSMSDLADTLAIPAPTVTRIVRELSDDALVYRRPSASDARSTVVEISRVGSDRLDRASAILRARLNWE